MVAREGTWRARPLQWEGEAGGLLPYPGCEVGRGLLLSFRRMAPHPRVWFQSTFCAPPGPGVLRPH